MLVQVYVQSQGSYRFSDLDTMQARYNNGYLYKAIARTYLMNKIGDEEALKMNGTNALDFAEYLLQQAQHDLIVERTNSFSIKHPDDWYYCHELVTFNNEDWPLSSLQLLQALKHTPGTMSYAKQYVRDVPDFGQEERKRGLIL